MTLHPGRNPRFHRARRGVNRRRAGIVAVCVGTVAIGVAFTLFQIDNGLTSSNREVRVNNTLKEIRSAQASFETRNVDQRVLVTQSVHGSK